MKERKTSAVAAHSDRKPPEIFCRIFITLTSSSGRLLAKGTASAFIGPSRCPYRERPTFAATAICARHLIYSGIYRIRRRFSRRREIDTEPSGFLVCADGGRVQEIADLRACDLQLTKPFQVRLFGKGRKERYCPLLPQTAAVLRAFCHQRNLDLRSEANVFLNHRNQPLTRFGIRHILARCLSLACEKAPNLRKKRLHPHSVRHSTAVALLKSGVDLSTISHMLGHASPTTTNRYAKVDLEMKRQAIAKIKPVPRQSRKPWSKDHTVLDWLESL